MNIVFFIMGIAASCCIIKLKKIWAKSRLKKDPEMTIEEFFITLMVLNRGLDVPYKEIIENFDLFLEDFRFVLYEVKKYGQNYTSRKNDWLNLLCKNS